VGFDAVIVARRSTVAVSNTEVQPSIKPPSFTMIDVMLTSFALQLKLSPVESSRHVCADTRVDASRIAPSTTPTARAIFDPDMLPPNPRRTPSSCHIGASLVT
jgi:hypothetical protein